MLNIFLDTNVYLNFYRFSNEDLKKLESLIALIEETSDIRLFTTEQVKNEFYRNRENVINDLLERIDKIGSGGLNLPSFSKKYSEHSDLQTSYRKLQEGKKILKGNILEDVFNFNLAPDVIINELFKLATTIEESEEIIFSAKHRTFLGNPPGKKGSNGDAINWECLLKSSPDGEDLYFIGGDGDFKSPIDSRKFNLFLLYEWKKSKGSTIYFYENLSIFLKEKFSDIEELDDYVKNKKIDLLKYSHNFNHSRQILRDLLTIGNFNDGQLSKIFENSYGNDQVWGAHRYTPSMIGGVIQELIKDKHSLIPMEEYDNFCKVFGIKKEIFYHQNEDGDWYELPF